MPQTQSSAPFLLHVSCGGPFGPAIGSRTASDITIPTSGIMLSNVLPEVAAQCLPEDRRLPPPGYELAIFSGVSVYGGDTKLYFGTLNEIHAAADGAQASPSNSAASNDCAVCMFLQPKNADEQINPSVLTKGARVYGGIDMGQLVFVRRDCGSLGEPGAMLFPSVDAA